MYVYPTFIKTLPMNKKYFLFPLSMLIISMGHAQSEKKLAAAFIQSVAKNNFQLLEPYIIKVTTARSLFGKEFAKITPAKQAATLKESRTRLMDRWKTAVDKATSNKIDFGKVEIRQVLTGPIEGNNSLNSLLVTYQYNGVEWDDLFFIVNKQGAAKYLIDLPNNTAMFSLNEGRRGKNLKDLQFQKDKNDPGIKQHLKDVVELLKKLSGENDVQQLYSHIVYSGEADKENRWKRTIDPSKEEDVVSAKRMMDKLKNGFSNCDKINYGDVRIEKESEGVWHVISTTCGTQKHTYAFLKINNIFVLGDID